MSPLLTRETVLSRMGDLPALPSVVGDILGAIDDEGETVERLVGRISSDPVLVARILGAANAAAQGGRPRIGSLPDAVALLGFNRVRRLVLMTALVRQFQPLAPGFDPTAFWRHSLAVAVCAGVLARETAFDAALAFNAGLLHDIGQLLIVVAFPRESEAVLARMEARDCDIAEAERDVLGIDHGEVGSVMAACWRLPEAFVEAIDGHHRPDATNFEAYSNIVHVAEVLSCALDIGTVPCSVVPALSEHARAHLGLSWPAVAGHFGEIEARYRAACLDSGF